jgi:hypothetical protein
LIPLKANFSSPFRFESSSEFYFTVNITSVFIIYTAERASISENIHMLAGGRGSNLQITAFFFFSGEGRRWLGIWNFIYPMCLRDSRDFCS